jgi:hypothetical protein
MFWFATTGSTIPNNVRIIAIGWTSTYLHLRMVTSGVWRVAGHRLPHHGHLGVVAFVDRRHVERQRVTPGLGRDVQIRPLHRSHPSHHLVREWFI